MENNLNAPNSPNFSPENAPNSADFSAQNSPEISQNNFAENGLKIGLNLNSLRAKKARFNAKFGKIFGGISLAIFAILFFAGIFALIFAQSFGWVLLGFSATFFAFSIWKKHDLQNLAPLNSAKKGFVILSKAEKSQNPNSDSSTSLRSAQNDTNFSGKNQIFELSDIFAGDILGEIDSQLSPKNLAKAVMKTRGGIFFAVRFGISREFLPDLVSENSADTGNVFAKTVEIWQNLPEKPEIISSAILCAALILTSNSAREVLNALHLDENDILAGAEWFSHIDKLVKDVKTPKMTGGIARDWSFGYISNLQKYGVNLSEKYSRGARSLLTNLPSYEEILARMTENLGGGGRKNVALVGGIGAGKSTVVEAFAEKLLDARAKIPAELKFQQIFALDASALISAAAGRGQIENLVNRLFFEAFSAKNIILFLDNAELFFEDATGAVDLANILQPILEGGALKIILALDEQKFLQIAQKKPALAAALNRLEMPQISREDILKISEDAIINIEYQRKCTFMWQSLAAAYRLSERYLHDLAQPGRAISLLENSAGFSENGLITEKSVSDAIEKTLGVKVGGAISNDDPAEREKLLNLENLIHERMINQTAAVSAVSAALRRARAGVRNENRPIGTFLFLGPTGVGKTELAKSLADVYFGGENHLVRIDLNEYVRAEDVARLIADGAENPNSLSAQVQKNPFSVVLLDEIEKAHPNVLATLLQVLDEGILRDINNREIGFRDTILIATSNAGAERIREYIDAGWQVEQFSEQFQNELISSRSFAPEFLNRFDEIVVFRPLTKTELLQVIDLILVGINKNLATQKVAVAVDDDAKFALVEAGYDPRLGARPMRRIVQKTVENIVAQKLLSGELVAGSGLRITLADISASGGIAK